MRDSARFIYEEIDTERLRQERLKSEGRFDFTCANIPSHALALSVLVEEVGEAARALMGQEGFVRDGGDLRKELIQIAAVTVAWIEKVDAEKGAGRDG